MVSGAAVMAELGVLAQVLMIDLMLAGDNAVVVGMAVAGLRPVDRRRAILLGIAGATIIRVVCAFAALRLLAIVGLTFAGGVLLLWVCWRMYRELRRGHGAEQSVARAPKSLRMALLQIMLADISMSLDNVLAVAGAAHGHPYLLAAGLAISVLLMGAAAELLAKLLETQRWIAWAGLLIVLFVALKLIWEGYGPVAQMLGRAG
jgi:YjbE family integral membrane protein